jgi:hypothetical protein
MRCWNCGAILEADTGVLKIGKSDSCSECDFDLHVCKNCQFYERASYNECKENQAEWVRDKEKRNYCDYFEPNSHSGAKNEPIQDARSVFDNLFKN